MPHPLHVWMRHETRPSECRAPVTPEDAAVLVDRGVRLTVEDSPQRVFALSDYVAAGCRTAPAGAWPDAPSDAYIIGLKELPDTPRGLRHRHIYFGHAYKGQVGARDLLDRFAVGGGALLDLEYLTDSKGRRLAAFGYWAGYLGAALAALHLDGRLPRPLAPFTRAELDGALRLSDWNATRGRPRAVVIGALGRCGRGARDALATAGITVTGWDVEQTRHLDRKTLLAHDLLVNAILATGPVDPFLTAADLDTSDRRLSLVCDVTCDVHSDHNVLPFNDTLTTWKAPVRRPSAVQRSDDPPLDVIAIDNLPSLLPTEASRSFSAKLLPYLPALGDTYPAWVRCLQTFRTAQEAEHA